MKEIDKIKFVCMVLAVVLIGVGLFDLGFTILYKEELKAGSCELCFDLNPDFAECEFYKPWNFSDLNLTIPIIYYEE
jgi:hypothetical protein